MKASTQLEVIIQSCKDVSFFAHLKDKIFSSNQLSEDDKILFEKICLTTIEFENWNNSDLQAGVATTIKRLKEEFRLSDESSSIVARLASYDWK